MQNLTPGQRATALFTPMLHTREDLLQGGMTSREVTAAVRAGHLLRPRRNRYARPGIDRTVIEAVRAGGRLTCLSLLQVIGVFVLTNTTLHVQVPRNSSRLPARKADAPHLHWVDEPDAQLLHVSTLHAAVRHAVRCQTPRATVATLDSLTHHGLMTMAELQALFEDLPARFRPLLRLVDSSAASGPETLVRLMLRALGLAYETQVLISGVGYVDFIVDGWLIIECDSREFHEGWGKQQQDRHRDIAAARAGYVTIRPLAADILRSPLSVQAALREIIDVFGGRFAGRGVRRSGKTTWI
ncbi:endonuclease domain-containing protein [Microbacterium oxydans]|uniref:endonuclease domain-containing protein n=1 Tax=Microbacterium oxydans TaxID=82380 RepID=UPI0022B1300E|nr:hypothetical protein [Microbacterium oxydans]MCZ4302544.1 hypothetical protein [Microbacterium oxydans]